MAIRKMLRLIEKNTDILYESENISTKEKQLLDEIFEAINKLEETEQDNFFDNFNNDPNNEGYWDENKTYNGYTNFATWTVASVIDNVEEIYQHFQTQAHKYLDENENDAEMLMFDDIKDYVENNKPAEYNLIWNPIINDVCSSEINYREIAINILEEVALTLS